MYWLPPQGTIYKVDRSDLETLKNCYCRRHEDIIVSWWADLYGSHVWSAEFLNIGVTASCNSKRLCWLCANFSDLYANKMDFLFVFLQVLTHLLRNVCAFVCVILRKVVKHEIVTPEENHHIESLFMWVGKEALKKLHGEGIFFSCP